MVVIVLMMLFVVLVLVLVFMRTLEPARSVRRHFSLEVSERSLRGQSINTQAFLKILKRFDKRTSLGIK